MNNLTRICPYCKNIVIYKTLGHRNDAEKHKRGCRKCQNVLHPPISNTKCDLCGKPIYRTPYRQRRTPNHFCSFSCKNKYYSGPKSFNWKGGKTLLQKRQHKRQKELKLEKKKKAVDLMGNKCEICGYSKCIAALDFHHIDPLQKNSDIKELMVRKWKYIEKEIKKCKLLCANCHRELHWKENHG